MGGARLPPAADPHPAPPEVKRVVPRGRQQQHLQSVVGGQAGRQAGRLVRQAVVASLARGCHASRGKQPLKAPPWPCNVISRA